MSSEQSINLIVHINMGEDVSPHRLDQTTRQLRAEIQHMGVESVELVEEAEIPGGSMSAEAITLGALAIAVLPVVLPALIQYIMQWQAAVKGRMITIKRKMGDEEIEVVIPESMSPQDLERLVRVLNKPGKR